MEILSSWIWYVLQNRNNRKMEMRIMQGTLFIGVFVVSIWLCCSRLFIKNTQKLTAKLSLGLFSGIIMKTEAKGTNSDACR